MIFNYPSLNTMLVNRMTKDKEETNDTSQEYTKDLKQVIIEYSETFDKLSVRTLVTLVMS